MKQGGTTAPANGMRLAVLVAALGYFVDIFTWVLAWVGLWGVEEISGAPDRLDAAPLAGSDRPPGPV